MIVYLQVLRYTSDMLLLCDNNSITAQRVEQEATGEVLLNSRCIKYITIAFCFCDLRRLITLTTKSLYAVKFYHTVSVSYFLKKDVTQFKDMRKRLGKALCWKKKGNDFALQGIEFMAIRPETCARIRRSCIVLYIFNSISSCVLNHCITTLAYVGNQITGTLIQQYCGPFLESPAVKLFFFTCKIEVSIVLHPT